MTTPAEGPASGYDAAGRPEPQSRQNDGTRRGATGLSQYLDRGWRLVPCHNIEKGWCSCKQADCAAPGKHPRTMHGVKDASSDPTVVREWWQRWPNANWGLATGRDSGVVAVDLDPRHDGYESFDRWEEDNLPDGVPETLRSDTGGGGQHIFFAYPAEGTVGNRNKWLEGVDVRGENGYVILAPSNHVSGGKYSWRTEFTTPLAQMPEALLRAVTGGGSGGLGATPLGTTGSILAGIPEGSRDDTLFRACCRWRRQLNDDYDAVVVLALQAARNSTPPFPEREAMVKVEQAFKQDHRHSTAGDSDPDDGRARLHLRSAAEVLSEPDPEYLVHGVLPKAALFQVVGQSGTYKSFLMLDLAASIANGRPWMGHGVGESGAVALVLGEGGADAGQRLAAWLAANPGATPDLLLYSVEEGLDLMDAEMVTSIIADLETYAEEKLGGLQWSLIIFDTQADHMASGDEDKAKDVTIVKLAMQRIRQATGAAVGLVHHTGHDESRARGSSRWRQAMDVVMHVHTGNRVENVKQKFGPKFPTFRFETDEAAGSLYVRPDSRAPMAIVVDHAAESADIGRRAILHLLEYPTTRHKGMSRAVSIQAARWADIRADLVADGYLLLESDAQGRAGAMTVTDEGAAWASGG